jgi:hypothetical protein
MYLSIFEMIKDFIKAMASQVIFVLRLYKMCFLTTILILLIVFIQFGCDNPTGLEDNKPPIVLISPTEAKGPGGPAYLAGDIKDYVHPSKIVTNTHIYVMNQQDYSDTIASVFVISSNASFKITDLPEEKVDLIFMNDEYLCSKIGKLSLQASGNSFYNPNSSGFFIDSTVFITNNADSVGRLDAPLYGLQGYDAGIAVYLKLETSDSLGWEIIRLSGCDTLHVYKYDDPVFDPFENDVYYLNCPNIKSVSEKLIYFNWHKEINRAGQIFQMILQ